MSLLDAAVRLTIAVVMGAAIGFDRERSGKPAGLRTHVMVALGASAFIMLGLELLVLYSPDFDGAQIDPTRIIEGVVGGIGFLGAGTIIRGKGGVEGVTTAATIWMTGAVGVACGLGAFPIAVIALVLSLLTLIPLERLGRRIEP